jgi:hypothetical protein
MLGNMFVSQWILKSYVQNYNTLVNNLNVSRPKKQSTIAEIIDKNDFALLLCGK